MATPGIDLYDLYNALLSLINSSQTGWVKPQTNFQTWVNEINIEMWRYYKKQWENNQDIVDTFALPFLQTINITLSKISGAVYDFALYPKDYGGFSSARILVDESLAAAYLPKCDTLDSDSGICKKYVDPDEKAAQELQREQKLSEQKIFKIDNARIGRIQDHAWDNPRKDNPIITQAATGFKVFPKGLGVIVLDYFVSPTPVKFAYTIDPTTDLIVYNKAGSIQPQWPYLAFDEMLYRLGKKAGIYTKSWDLYQASEKERELNVK